MTDRPNIPAALALIQEVCAGKPTIAALSVAYSIALANHRSMEGHWRAANLAIAFAMWPDADALTKMRRLDRVKRGGWKLYEGTVARLGLPATAPLPPPSA